MSRVTINLEELGMHELLYNVAGIEHNWDAPGVCSTTYMLEPDFYSLTDVGVFPLTEPFGGCRNDRN